MNTKWIVITGGPASGKTTLLDELSRLGYPTIQEAARSIIDDALKAGISVNELRRDEADFQQKVARRRIELEDMADSAITTFIDRGMPDSLAYMRYYDFPVDAMIEERLRSVKYKKVFLAEPLPQYIADYARTEDANFAETIAGLLLQAYREHGMEPITLPPVSVSERLQIILRHVPPMA